MSQIKLPQGMVQYFSLFLVQKEEESYLAGTCWDCNSCPFWSKTIPVLINECKHKIQKNSNLEQHFGCFNSYYYFIKILGGSRNYVSTVALSF